MSEPYAPNLSRAERVLHWVLNKVFRHRDVVVDGELYLRRWFITPRSWSKRLFLHCILKADDQRILHDHPWDFTTLILKGGYNEVFRENIVSRDRVDGLKVVWPAIRTRMSEPGTLRRYPAEHVHAVAPLRGPAWTLVCASQARRVWGFWVPKGYAINFATWVDWRTHLGLPDAPEHVEDIIPPATSASPGRP